MPLRRKVRPAGAAARRAAMRWWLLSLAATGAAVTAAAALLAVALHLSGSAAASASSGAHYRLSQPREAEELRWEQEVAPPQLASPQSRKLDGAAEKSLWLPAPSRRFAPCLAPSPEYKGPVASRGYLLVHTNGGLNQMRAGISDMVAVARILNATLIIPELDKKSFWHDRSNFSDVFDEEHFINSLASDVKIERKLPKELVKAPKSVRYFKSWSGVDYYQDEISPLWDHRQVIRAAKSDSRLANNYLPIDIQKLRCRAFFQALRFAPPIEALGKLLVERMRSFGPKALVRLFDKVNSGLLREGKRLSERILDIHRKRQGSPRKRKGPVSGTKGKDRFRSEEAFYENPLPDCLCQPGSPDSDDTLVSI
nr:unnamed protein product [Digitaria exilis]